MRPRQEKSSQWSSKSLTNKIQSTKQQDAKIQSSRWPQSQDREKIKICGGAHREIERDSR